MESKESQSRKNIVVLEPRLESGEVARYFSKISPSFINPYEPTLAYRWNRIGITRNTDFNAFRIFGRYFGREDCWHFSDRFHYAIYLFDGGVGLRESKEKNFEIVGGVCINVHINDMERSHTLETNSESIRWRIEGITPIHGEGYSAFPISSNNLITDYQIMSILANSHSLHSRNGLFCEDALREVEDVLKDYAKLIGDGVIQDHGFQIPKIPTPQKISFLKKFLIQQKEKQDEQEPRKKLDEFYKRLENFIQSYKIGEERHEDSGWEYPLGRKLYLDYFQEFSVDDFVYRFLAANGRLFTSPYDGPKDSLERCI